MNGNYKQINAGYLGEAISFLTGAPTLDFMTIDASLTNDDPEITWNLIKESDDKRYIIQCATNSSASD